jgi:hypothetical protein
MAQVQHEQRIDGRSPAWGTLVFYQPDKDAAGTEHLGAVEDIGPSGLFIGMREPPSVGEVLRLKIYSQAGPAGGSTISARVRVCWRRILQEPKGAGVQVIEEPEGQTGALKQWIDSLSRTGSAPLFAIPD